MVMGRLLEQLDSLFQQFEPLLRRRQFFEIAPGSGRKQGRQPPGLFPGKLFLEDREKTLEIEGAGRIAEHAGGEHLDRVIEVARGLLLTGEEAFLQPLPLCLGNRERPGHRGGGTRFGVGRCRLGHCRQTNEAGAAAEAPRKTRILSLHRPPANPQAATRARIA